MTPCLGEARRSGAGPAKALPLSNNGPSPNPLNHEADDLRAGVDAILRGDDFEAHERWEAHWRRLPQGPIRRGLQGLILIAVGRYKLTQGKPATAARLWRRAEDRLREAPPSFLGFDRDPLIDWALQLRQAPRTPVPSAFALY